MVIETAIAIDGFKSTHLICTIEKFANITLKNEDIGLFTLTLILPGCFEGKISWHLSNIQLNKIFSNSNPVLYDISNTLIGKFSHL